ncbi:acyltransferase [Treponema socranskii]|uniref:acyltransferase n=1 Tax=Treponema socranskii TaxID=53419 RepID=UPI003D6DE761
MRLNDSSCLGERNLRLDLIKGITCYLIVFLHNTMFTNGTDILNIYDCIILFLHSITRVGVPVFMGITGYFVFFEKERQFNYGIRKIGRYLIILLLWEVIYFSYEFFTKEDLSKTFFHDLSEIDITCGHLWYLKLYIGILAVFPIIKVIVKDERVLLFYVIFWIVFFSLRFTLGLFYGLIPNLKKILLLFQIPFFEYKGYLGGTVGSEYPTVYIGIFIIIGAYINLLERKRFFVNMKIIIVISIIAYVVTVAVTIAYALLYDGFKDYFFQPLELHILIMVIGFITLFYYIPDSFLKSNSRIIEKLSNYSLGIYIIHPLVGSLLKHTSYNSIFDRGFNVLIMNIINWIVVSFISFFVIGLIRKLIPHRICNYII